MTIICKYIDNNLELMKFHRHLQKIEGIKAMSFDDLCRERAFVVIEDGEMVGGWVEQVFPFERCLANIPLAEREEVLKKFGLSYWNSVFMGSYHLDRKRGSWKANIALAWHSLSAPRYSSKKHVVFASYEPKLFDKWTSSGAITIDERESKLLPEKMERVMFYRVEDRVSNFLRGAFWILKKALTRKNYRVKPNEEVASDELATEVQKVS